MGQVGVTNSGVEQVVGGAGEWQLMQCDFMSDFSWDRRKNCK